MVWKDHNDESKGIAPCSYTIENNTYSIKIEQTAEERKEDLKSWMEFLGNMWGDWRGWWVSGAIAISFITDTYPRTHTNTDIALLRESDLLDYMIERAEQNNLYLFQRLRSYKKTWSKDDIRKYEVFYPISKKEAISNLKSNRNYQFCSIDHNGNIVNENRIYYRIKLYFHHLDKKERLISSEDKRVIEPSWLSNTSIYTTRTSKKVYSVSLDYLQFNKRSMLSSWRWGKNPKHRQDLERIMQYFEKKSLQAVIQPLGLV